MALSPAQLWPKPPILTLHTFSGCYDCFSLFSVGRAVEHQRPQSLKAAIGRSRSNFQFGSVAALRRLLPMTTPTDNQPPHTTLTCHLHHSADTIRPNAPTMFSIRALNPSSAFPSARNASGSVQQARRPGQTLSSITRAS